MAKRALPALRDLMEILVDSQIAPGVYDENGVRCLCFDSGTVQSAMRVSAPFELDLSYTQAFEQYEKSAARGNPLAKRKLEHRKQIEEDAARVGTAEKLLREQGARRATEPPKPAAPPKPTENPKIVTEAPKTKSESEKELAAEAAARDKLRAQLRERAKKPVGEPFE